MSATQKFAWFNLAVVGLTLVTVLSLLPFLGKSALGGSASSGSLVSDLYSFARRLSRW